jgi:hypothetical protein
MRLSLRSFLSFFAKVSASMALEDGKRGFEAEGCPCLYSCTGARETAREIKSALLFAVI